ncbi:MAG: Hint domain-containing protein [Verrucomicrobiota bacterium]|nr:Hint domain-containing protein [Verrucomicrobiota bacterium]
MHTPSGAKRIEELAPDEQVLSWNERSARVESGTVEAVFTSKRAGLIELRTANGSVTCSPEHPIYTAETTCQPAAELAPPDRLMLLESPGADRLASTSEWTITEGRVRRPVKVYNLSVGKNRNYFVGPDRVLCHNKGM